MFSLYVFQLTGYVLQQSASSNSVCATDFINNSSGFCSKMSGLYMKPGEEGMNHKRELKRSLVSYLKPYCSILESMLLLLFSLSQKCKGMPQLHQETHILSCEPAFLYTFVALGKRFPA